MLFIYEFLEGNSQLLDFSNMSEDENKDYHTKLIEKVIEYFELTLEEKYKNVEWDTMNKTFYYNFYGLDGNMLKFKITVINPNSDDYLARNISDKFGEN